MPPRPPFIAPAKSGSSFNILRVAIVLGCIFILLLGAAFAWSFKRRAERRREAAKMQQDLVNAMSNAQWQVRNIGAAPSPGRSSGNLGPIPFRQAKLELPTNAVSGQIGGHEFHYEHAIVSMHNFVLREGKFVQPDRQIRIITFVRPEDLAGKTLLVTPENKMPRLSVQAEWVDASNQRRFANAQNGYSLRLKCGPIQNGRMSGSIELQMPGAATTAIKGDFVAAVQ
jgi:hypothetical protein